MTTHAFELRSVSCGYDGFRVAEDVSIFVQPGEIVGLTGHNAAGKSSVMKAAFGIVPLMSGSIAVQGIVVTAPMPHLLVSLDVCYLPQAQTVFERLSVVENIRLRVRGKSQELRALDRVGEIIPALAARGQDSASHLSGGERQIVALAALLETNARVLLLDEPSYGLSDSVLTRIFADIRKLCDRGVSALIIEHRLRHLSRVADRMYVMSRGRVVAEGVPAELLHRRELVTGMSLK